MKALALASLLLLGGCMVYAHPAYVEAPPPAPRPVARPVPAAAPAPRLMSEREAIDVAFQLSRERGLAVDEVKHAHLDGAGRWHVDLRGHGDKAKVILDARDGRLLKGQFKDKGHGHGHDRDDEWDD